MPSRANCGLGDAKLTPSPADKETGVEANPLNVVPPKTVHPPVVESAAMEIKLAPSAATIESEPLVNVYVQKVIYFVFNYHVSIISSLSNIDSNSTCLTG